MNDYNQIDNLPLPAGLMYRHYLKEYHYKHKVRTISNIPLAAGASTSSAAVTLPSAM
jgi:shikimate kinase